MTVLSASGFPALCFLVWKGKADYFLLSFQTTQQRNSRIVQRYNAITLHFILQQYGIIVSWYHDVITLIILGQCHTISQYIFYTKYVLCSIYEAVSMNRAQSFRACTRMELSNAVNQLFTAKSLVPNRLLFKYNSVYYTTNMIYLCIDYAMIKEISQ